MASATAEPSHGTQSALNPQHSHYPRSSSPPSASRFSPRTSSLLYAHRLVSPGATAPLLGPVHAAQERPFSISQIGFADTKFAHGRYLAHARCDRESPVNMTAEPRTMTSNDFPRHGQAYPHSGFHGQAEQQPQQSYSDEDAYSATPSRSYAQSYPFNAPHKPLIDFVTNEWQHNPKYSDHYSDYSDDDYEYFAPEKDIWPAWVMHLRGIRVPRRVQRWLLIYSLFLICCWFGWLYWLRPSWEQEKLLDDSLASAATKGSIFGINIRPEFADMVHMQQLDERLVPGATSEDRRLIIIGDVHGCKNELLKLLQKAAFNIATDHLIFTGDLVAKGPDSTGVIDLARDYGASCVRGNFEDRVLLAWKSMRLRVSPQLPGPDEDPNRKDDDLGEVSFSHGDYRERAIAAKLTSQQVQYLKSCPVILRVGRIPGFGGSSGSASGLFRGAFSLRRGGGDSSSSSSSGDGEVVVAHAGLIPGVELDRQDPFQVMNIRTIDLETRVPSELRVGEPWERLWNHHMAHLHPPSERVTVVYGHDAKRGLNVQKYSIGLDSGCVRGGSLTALVIDAKGRRKFVSVECEKRK